MSYRLFQLRSGLRDLICGPIVAAVGAGLTYLTYSLHGTHFVLFWGLIMVGLGQFGAGIVQMAMASQPPDFERQTPSDSLCDSVLAAAVEAEREGDLQKALGIYEKLAANPDYTRAGDAQAHADAVRSQLTATASA